MKSRIISCFTVGALCAATVPAADAAPVIYEPFDYATGDLSTNADGVGTGLSAWSDSGTTIDSPGLSFGDLETTGNRVSMSDDSSWATTGTSLNGLLDDGDKLWFSVIVTPGVVDTNPDFGFALGTDRLDDRNAVPMVSEGKGMGFRLKGGLKATAWDSAPSSGRTNPNSDSGIAATGGTTYLILGRLTFGATTDTVDIWSITNSDLSFDINTPDSTQTTTLDQTVFDTVSFSNKTASPRDQVDEIRFGVTSGDVLPVPEPGSLALLALGGLCVLRRRRG